jgi:hypothetical protein
MYVPVKLIRREYNVKSILLIRYIIKYISILNLYSDKIVNSYKLNKKIALFDFRINVRLIFRNGGSALWIIHSPFEKTSKTN